MPPRAAVVPCVLMRAGTSRGPFFLREWLPADERRPRRGPDRRHRRLRPAAARRRRRGQHADQQGGHRLARPTEPGCDVDYLFAQVGVGQRSVDTSPNCGNMLAGVGPFAIEQGLVPAADGTTTVRVYNVNTRSRIDATVQTPGRRVTYAGDARIDGVAGTAAPIRLELPGRLGRGHRLGLPDRAADRRHRRRRGHLPRRRHAADDHPRRRPRRHRPRDPRPARRRHHPARTVGVVASHGRPADGARRGHRQASSPNRCSSVPATTSTASPRATSPPAGATPRTPRPAPSGWPPPSPCPAPWPATASDLPAGTHDIAVLHPQGRIDVQVELGDDGDQVVVTQASLVRTARKILQGDLHLPDYVFSAARPATAVARPERPRRRRSPTGPSRSSCRPRPVAPTTRSPAPSPDGSARASARPSPSTTAPAPTVRSPASTWPEPGPTGTPCCSATSPPTG